MSDKCASCYGLRDVAIKVRNTEKYFNGVYKRQCAVCSGWYVKKGSRKKENGK